MSTTSEKFKSVCRAGFFLEKCLRDKKYEKEARMILRHFPGVIETEEIFNGREPIKPESLWKDMSNERDSMRKSLKERGSVDREKSLQKVVAAYWSLRSERDKLRKKVEFLKSRSCQARQ